MLRSIVLACLLGITLAACSIKDADIIAEHHSIADSLAGQADLSVDKARPILVAPFLEVNQLDQYTDFGSMAAEHMASRMSQLGFTVLDIKLDRDVLYSLSGNGALLLSDELKNLSASLGAQAVLLGTYAPGRDNVFVAARLVRAADNVLLASEDYALPLGPDTEALLGDELGGLSRRGSSTWY